MAASVGAIFFSFVNLQRGFAGPYSGPSLTTTASDLSRILGTQVTIHATAEVANSKTLPIVCQALLEAVGDVATDAESAVRLGKLLNVVVIEGPRTSMRENSVRLKDHVLTIQTIQDPSEADDLRSAVADVLKKLLQRDAKMEPAR